MRRAPQLGQNPRRSPKAPTVGATESDQAFLAVPMVDMIRFHAIQSDRRV
jgi:hypothetical protein